MQKNTQKHCINTMKIYDWIHNSINLRLCEPLGWNECVTDQICGIIDLPCGENAFVWKVRGELSISGSVKLFHEAGCENMEVIINGKTVCTLSAGDVHTMEYTVLRSIEVRCKGNSDGSCIGKYCVDLYYELNQNQCRLMGCHLECFLSDECGNPSNSVICREILQPTGRRNRKMTLPNGTTIVLQQVKMIIKGFITVQVMDMKCKVCIIPFEATADLILCAPPGTFLMCEITDFECTVYVTADCKSIELAISLCQQVQVMANVTIEMEANYCLPRSKLTTHLWIK